MNLGKYGKLFQERLKGKERGVDHWSAGACLALEKYGCRAACLAIEGHHIGLQAYDDDVVDRLDPESINEWSKVSESDYEKLLQLLENELGPFPTLKPEQLIPIPTDEDSLPTLGPMLDTRMLYSCLVDADYLDTEAHHNGNQEIQKKYRENDIALSSELLIQMKQQFQNYLEQIQRESTANPQLNQLRNQLREDCIVAAQEPNQIRTLTAPTGSGKTLAMIAFALENALKYNLQRIIFVIPYLSILDQTASQLKEIFGKSMILEHHSLAQDRTQKEAQENQEQDDEEEAKRKAQFLTENWDAPMIVTTSVQFLESLFANRPKACRKLHRIAESVLLFDEVQTLPIKLVTPTLGALTHLAEQYRSTILFATATQPAFAKLDDQVKKMSPSGWQPKKIVPKDRNLFQHLQRVSLNYDLLKNPVGWEELANHFQNQAMEQGLFIVNTKKQAQQLFSVLETKKYPMYHLSTSMTPFHRTRTLIEARRRLQQNKPCILVSTQCIEAGVDVDFPIVYRSLAPLEALAQAAGRCNREGKQTQNGTTYVFKPLKELYPKDESYVAAAQFTQTFLENQDFNLQLNDPKAFQEYYSKLFKFRSNELDFEELCEAIDSMNFPEVSKLYRLIEDATVNLMVPDPEHLDLFRSLHEEALNQGISKVWIDRAKPIAINFYRGKQLYENVDLQPAPFVKDLQKGQPVFSHEWYIYSNSVHYHPSLGLIIP